jgi:hypothetical protein
VTRRPVPRRPAPITMIILSRAIFGIRFQCHFAMQFDCRVNLY